MSVTITDTSLTAEPARVDPGTVRFNIRNDGTRNHEFVVVDTERDAGLPIAAGKVDVNAADLRLVVEIEAFSPKAPKSTSQELSEGFYELFCNLPGHYQAGVRTRFRVLRSGGGPNAPTGGPPGSPTPTLDRGPTAPPAGGPPTGY